MICVKIVNYYLPKHIVNNNSIILNKIELVAIIIFLNNYIVSSYYK